MISPKYKEMYDVFINHYKDKHVNPWHEISEEELNAKDMLDIITTSTYRIKYIKNEEYIFIDEGYAILADGSEPIHYFLHHIFENIDDAKIEIIKEYQKKNK